MTDQSTIMTYSRTVEMLQSEYSDLHKDMYGFRPRGGTDKQWGSLVWLRNQLDNMNTEFEQRKETFAGREGLRNDGWHIEETDPQLIKHAGWLKKERDRAYERYIGECV